MYSISSCLFVDLNYESRYGRVREDIRDGGNGKARTWESELWAERNVMDSNKCKAAQELRRTSLLGLACCPSFRA